MTGNLVLSSLIFLFGSFSMQTEREVNKDGQEEKRIQVLRENVQEQGRTGSSQEESSQKVAVVISNTGIDRD